MRIGSLAAALALLAPPSTTLVSARLRISDSFASHAQDLIVNIGPRR